MGGSRRRHDEDGLPPTYNQGLSTKRRHVPEIQQSKTYGAGPVTQPPPTQPKALRELCSLHSSKQHSYPTNMISNLATGGEKGPQMASVISSQQASEQQPHPTNMTADVGTDCETTDGILMRLTGATLDSFELIEQQSKNLAALKAENRWLRRDNEIRKRLRKLELRNHSNFRITKARADERASKAEARAKKAEDRLARMSEEMMDLKFKFVSTTTKMALDLRDVRAALKKKTQRIKNAF